MRLYRFFRKERKTNGLSYTNSHEYGEEKQWFIEQAVQSSNNGIAFANLDGKLTYVNPSFLKIWGYHSEQEVLGSLVTQYWLNPEEAANIIKELKKSGSYQGEMQGIRSDGVVIDIKFSASLMFFKEEHSGRMMASFIDITQQKAFERSLKEQQQYFRTLADTIPDLIVRFDRQLRLTYMNQQALLFSTPVPMNTNGIKITDLNLPGNIEGLLTRNIDLVFSTKEEIIIEDKIQHAGEEKIFESRILPEFDASGDINSVMVVARDVTAAKKSLQQKAHLATIVESSDDAIISKDLEGNILSWNRGAEAMYEYSANEMTGRNISLLVPSDKIEDEKKIIREILSGNKIVHYETTRVNKSGKRLTVSLTASPITNPQGQIIAVSVIARDITTNKRNFLERETIYHISQAVINAKNLNEIFRLIHEKMEELFNTRNFFVALYNKENNILRIPYFKDEKDGRDVLDPEKSLTGYLIKKGRPLFLSPADILNITSEMGIDRNELGAHSKIWMGVPIYSNGEITGALVAQDYENPNAYTPHDLDFMKFLASQLGLIIEQKQAEKHLIDAKNRAEESDRLKSAFLTNMSHEIRTPLNAIAGFTQLLTDNNFPPEKRAGFSVQIKNATYDLISLVSNIIEASKLQSGKIQYKKEKFLVRDLLEEIYMEAIELRNRKEKEYLMIRLKMEVPEQCIMYTDPNKLKQILINLIDNAIKFTEEGHIEVGTRFTTQDKICFYVKDTGIGISEKHQKDIFGSFQKIEDSVQKLYRGAGLGLTLCKGLTKLLDGEIAVESRHLKGAEFKIIFPFEETTSGVSDHPTEAKQLKDHSKLKGKTILAAEDVSSNLLYLKELTSLLGIKLIEASNGNEAIEKVAQTESIDLILMDILMPEKDGFEAARQIRKTHKNIPIIAQSAFTWNESKKSVYQGVFDDYLTKPFSKEQLTQMLIKYL